jgi:protein-S-isoprenylcysteine O-methyltransferase Ste14
MTLKAKLILRLALTSILLSTMLFVPAGSLHFWQGWTLMATTFIPTVSAYAHLYKHDPKLLERRLQNKENVREQKILIRLLKPFFFAVLLLPGFDYRFGWSRRLLGAVPVWLVVLSLALILAGFSLTFWVLKVNSFASRTIRVEAEQAVIATGPYALVRHPMYLGSILMWLFIPLALGSYVSWPAFVLLVPFYVARLLNEEKVLRNELPGYPDYCQRTRSRLLPYIW